MESKKILVCWVILGQGVPISVEFIVSVREIFWKATPFPWILYRIIEKRVEPKGVEECICYQRSYNLGLKWFHIKLGLTLAIEIKHQQNI